MLITGGAGFVGATIASACLDAGHVPVVLDDFSTGVPAFVTGRDYYRGDIADGARLDSIFDEHPDIAAVVHCAAHIVVPESVREPLRYYRNNVAKTVELVAHLHRVGCRRLVFSSSAAIYAPAPDFTVAETSPIAPSSPYARTKAMTEQVLADAAHAGILEVLSLRYFNPVGADPRLRTGLQLARPTHALGQLLRAHASDEPFTITGTDWPTRDGTGIRDYVHVWDLARAHVRALERFDDVVAGAGAYTPLNLGTGAGTTVRELVQAVQDVTGTKVRVREGPRRPGDVAGAYARVDRARELLDWHAELSITAGVGDALAWLAVREERLARTRAACDTR